LPSGGYRRPNNPAPVSGPGKLSQRTDGGPADKRALTGGGEYGETKELAEFQSGAPMQGAQAGIDLGSGPHRGLLGAESARPDEPVTAGAELGDGPGPEMLGLDGDLENEDLQAVLAYLPALEAMANSSRGFPSTRAMIRRIRSEL
jgi:hypothetical protein